MENNTFKKFDEMYLGGSKSINEFLSYEKESKDEISLHIKRRKNIPTEKSIPLFLAGLKELANKIKNDPKFENIKKITITSWIVTTNPNIINRFGFKICNEDLNAQLMKSKYKSRSKNLPKEFEKIEPGYALISKIDFLNRFS